MIGRILKERYDIKEKIGSGGMADVYKAQDQRLGRTVAIKVLKAEYSSDREFLHRFYREACAAAKLSHPNIVNVYDIEEDSGVQFIVMEYVDSQNLKSYLKSLKRPLPPEQFLHIIRSILNALSFAHQKGIIHRDLKPLNILIGSDNSVKVTDFGIARAIFSDTITQTGAFMGSVHYISPEQAQGKAVTAPADLYSLGIMMFEILTGRLPFESDNPVAVALKHVQEAVPRPSSLNASISAPMEKIIMKALEKDPLMRYQNSEEMSADLERLSERPDAFPPHTSEPALLVTPQRPQPLQEPSSKRISRLEDTQEKKDRTFLKGVVTATLLILFFALASVAFLYSSRLLQDLETPDLIGKTYPEAQGLLAEKGLNIVIQSEQFSNSRQPGIILAQKPKAGEKIRPGKAIYVVLSKGDRMVDVPELKGFTIQKARQILIDRGLINIKVDQVFSEKVPEGIVIAQVPAPENMVSPASLVVLQVSKGPSREKIPDLTGRSKDEAQKILQKINVRLVISGTESSAQFPANSVIRQEPAPGTLLVKDSTVTVVLSKGMEGLNSPNLVGKTILEAQGICEPLGISLKIEGDEKGDKALIISQEPPAGESIADKIIRIKAENLAIVPELAGQKLADARDLIVKKGFLVGSVHYRESKDGQPDTVIEQEPQAGLEFQQGTKINIVIVKASAVPHSTPPAIMTPEPSPEATPQQPTGK